MEQLCTMRNGKCCFMVGARPLGAQSKMLFSALLSLSIT